MGYRPKFREVQVDASSLSPLASQIRHNSPSRSFDILALDGKATVLALDPIGPLKLPLDIVQDLDLADEAEALMWAAAKSIDIFGKGMTWIAAEPVRTDMSAGGRVERGQDGTLWHVVRPPLYFLDVHNAMIEATALDAASYTVAFAFCESDHSVPVDNIVRAQPVACIVWINDGDSVLLWVHASSGQ